MIKLYLAGLFLLCSAVIGFAADWPQWQGPDRNAISNESALLQQWPDDGPPLAWRVDGLGGGDSAPAVADGKLFGLSNRDGKEIVWARSESDGKEIWFTSLGDAVEQRVPQSKEGPGCTPAVDGDRLYVIGEILLIEPSRDELIVRGRFDQPDRSSVPAWAHPIVANGKLYIRDQGLLLCYDVSAER